MSITLENLRKYPINSRRGGSFFTMLIFIMLLISTALMYYYFQRTRFLERQIAALQNGEKPEQGALSELFSWVKGTEPTETQGFNTPAEPPKSTPRPQRQVVPDSDAEPDVITEEGPAEPVATPNESASLLPLDEATSQPVLLDTQVEPEATEAEPRGNREVVEPVQEEEAEQQPGQPINSLYDTQQPPPVRVRSPQRR